MRAAVLVAADAHIRPCIDITRAGAPCAVCHPLQGRPKMPAYPSSRI